MSAMSLKAELETWASALASYESNRLEESIAQFETIADTSKINWNIGIIHATMGNHELAIERFREGTTLDKFMTVGYFQSGVSNFMLGRYAAAHGDFEDALLYMRGNQTINYEQLGLDFRLYSAEVLFNCGLAKIYLGQLEPGLADLRKASTQKQKAEHEVIDDAIRDRGADYNVFTVPEGVLFRPSPGKLKNIKTRDYMGKAVLVAAIDPSDAYTTFTGITRLQRGQMPSGAPLDNAHPLSRSANVGAFGRGPASAPPIDTPALLPPAPSASISRSKTLAIARPSASNQLQVQEIQSSLSRSRSALALAPIVSPPSREPATGRRPTLNVDIPLSVSSLSPLASTIQGVPYPSEVPPRGRDSPPMDRITTPPERGTLRITELYDDYYHEIPSPGEVETLANLPPIGGAKKNALPSIPGVPPGATPPKLTRGLSLRATPAMMPPSAYTSPALGRSGTLLRAPSVASRSSRYDEGDIDGGCEMVKIRVKVHIGQLTRGMSAYPNQTYTEFVDSLHAKFPELAAGGLNVRFKDEDGDMLSMQDEGDFEAAVDVARVMANGRAEGKIEIWVD